MSPSSSIRCVPVPGPAARKLAVLKHLTLNPIRHDSVPRNGGIKVRRLIAATSAY